MHEERVVLAGGFLLEAVFRSHGDFRLTLKRGVRVLVEYKHAKDYEFKSVEKLRYDFEKDAEDAQRKA